MTIINLKLRKSLHIFYYVQPKTTGNDNSPNTHSVLLGTKFSGLQAVPLGIEGMEFVKVKNLETKIIKQTNSSTFKSFQCLTFKTKKDVSPL